MDNLKSEIIERLQLGEDDYWEFKQVVFRGSNLKAPKQQDLADEIAAFANSTGGTVLCGVTDAGEVQGMTRAEMDTLERLVYGAFNDSIRPPMHDVSTSRMTIESKALLVVKVQASENVHESPGGYYRRLGSSKRKMTGDEQMRLAQRRSQARFLWFDKQPLPDTGFNTLDESLWKPLLSAEGLKNPAAALQKLALLSPDESGTLRATVAGLLFCSREPQRWLPNASITATLYGGTDRAAETIDSKEISGPLQHQIREALAFITRNMRTAERKDPGRVNLPQYSVKALFEAVVNAVAHRDYSIKSSRIRLSMFADRLEINSPGSLPNNLTVDSMAHRQATRNEALTSVLARLPVGETQGSEDRQYFMEKRGDGVPIIARETRELCGRPPRYEVIDEAELRLVIPAAILEHSAASVSVNVYSDQQPLAGVDVLALFPNRTWKRATTDQHGEASFDLHSTHLPMTVFAASEGYCARVEYGWTPSERTLSLELDTVPEGGSVIFPNATGYLPGLSGRLNPILDTHGRTYLYATNIAINQGQTQPVHFAYGEHLSLTDADGRELDVRIIHIEGRSALVEYRHMAP